MTVGMMGSKDSQFTTPFVDVDEWRDAPVRHRYVHGGFEGTDLLFSIYFPPAEQYEGRFFQPLMFMSGTEHAVGMGILVGMGASIEFAVDNGAYLVESNLGRTNPFPGEDGTVTGFRASAATARYSRELAAEMYGEHRPYGYCYGGSGGHGLPREHGRRVGRRRAVRHREPAVHPVRVRRAVPCPAGAVGPVS
jgi:hypothetical protein